MLPQAILDSQFRKLAHMATSFQALLEELHIDLCRTTEDLTSTDIMTEAVLEMRDTIAEAIEGLRPLVKVDMREPFSV